MRQDMQCRQKRRTRKARILIIAHQPRASCDRPEAHRTSRCSCMTGKDAPPNSTRSDRVGRLRAPSSTRRYRQCSAVDFSWLPFVLPQRAPPKRCSHIAKYCIICQLGRIVDILSACPAAVQLKLRLPRAEAPSSGRALNRRAMEQPEPFPVGWKAHTHSSANDCCLQLPAISMNRCKASGLRRAGNSAGRIHRGCALCVST